MKRPPAPFRCIFCEGPGASSEHVWSDWMAPYFIRSPHQTHEARHNKPEKVGHAPPPRTGGVERHGSAVNKKIKAVCKTCNNGWMSEIEARAKAPLLELMNRRTHTISPDDQLAVLRWFVVKMFVIEFDKPAAPSFTPATRRSFCETRALPENLVVELVAYSGGPWTSSVARQVLWIGDHREEADPDAEDFIRNTLALTFGVGLVVMHAFHSYRISAEILRPMPDISRRIWPASGVDLSWPPARIMTTEGIDALANSFDDHLRSTRGYLPAL